MNPKLMPLIALGLADEHRREAARTRDEAAAEEERTAVDRPRGHRWLFGHIEWMFRSARGVRSAPDPD